MTTRIESRRRPRPPAAGRVDAYRPAASFDPAPTRKRIACWTAERQHGNIEILSLTGSVLRAKWAAPAWSTIAEAARLARAHARG